MEPQSTARLDLRLVPAALVAWGVSAAGVGLGLGPALAALSAAVGAAWLVGCALVSGRHPALRAAAAGVLGAAVVGAGFGVAVGIRADAVQHHPLSQRFGTSAWVTVTATDTPRQAGPGRVMFRAGLNSVDNDAMTGAVSVLAPASEFGQLSAGQPARFRARVTRPRRRDLSAGVLIATGRPELGRPPAIQRIALRARTRFAEVARVALPADQAAILPGLVLGDTAAVPAAMSAEFRAAGLTHLTAVSGANVSIVCAAMLLSAYLVGPRPAVGLAALALVGFVIVVQPGASVLRAAVMGAIGLLAVLSGRRRQSVPALAATVIALMVAAPELAVDPGFAMSVSATAALILLAPGWSNRLVQRGWPKPLADAASVALAAQLVTAPLVAAISGRFSVVGVIANLAVVVVIPPITVLGTAAAAVVMLWTPAAGLLIRFTGPELWWLLHVADLAAGLPGAAVPVPSGWVGMLSVGGAGVAGVLLWRWRWFRLTVAGAAVCLAAWSVSVLVGGP